MQIFINPVSNILLSCLTIKRLQRFVVQLLLTAVTVKVAISIKMSFKE